MKEALRLKIENPQERDAVVASLAHNGYAVSVKEETICGFNYYPSL